MTPIVEDKFTRFKDANWFEYLKYKRVIVGGAGGIGSWISLFLARIGMHVYVYDNDTYEESNLAGQFVKHNDIGRAKTTALKYNISEFTNQYVYEMYCDYDENSSVSSIMIGGFDNMKARKTFFENWVSVYGSDKNSILIDGRLAAQSYQIFCIQGGRQDQIDKYRSEYLFSDDEVAPLACTLKQTSHTAAGIASHMTGFLTNFATNVVLGEDITTVPFLFEYITEPNFVNSVVI
jgi:molybdopterin/thiamine biosynthesis adenylyltransferase